MPNNADFFKNPLRYFIGLVGEPGSGKTRQCISFPKCYFVSMGDSYGLRTILDDKANAQFRENLVWHEALDLENKGDAGAMFKTAVTSKDRDSIYGVLAHAKEMAVKGEVETFVLDGGSFLSDFTGAKISKTLGSSDGDRWTYYRQLKHDLTWFMNANVMPLVTRYQLNCLLTFHVQRASDEEKEKQTTKLVDWQPRIEGSFRASIAALPRAMIYLHQSVEQNGSQQIVKYKAYSQPVKVGHVGFIPGKNSYHLPPVMDVTDKDLYTILKGVKG